MKTTKIAAAVMVSAMVSGTFGQAAFADPAKAPVMDVNEIVISTQAAGTNGLVVPLFILLIVAAALAAAGSPAAAAPPVVF